MSDVIHNAFKALIELQHHNQQNQKPGLIIVPGIQKLFQVISLEEDLDEIARIGMEYGIAPSNTFSLLCLHGAYFRILTEKNSYNLAGVQFHRHMNSVYQGMFPNLNYYTNIV